jgi:site-specific DNA-methyltransferase (adenine-specific)
MTDRQKQNFGIYNKSSKRMSEIANASIDLVVTDPPFNIGCHFGDAIDDASHDSYLGKIQGVTFEIARVLSPNGIAIFLVPSAVRRDSETYKYPEIYSKLCGNAGLRFIDTFSYIINEDDYDCVPEKEIKSDISDRKCHSEEIQGLVFGKVRQEVKTFPKDKLYRYVPGEGHPCPYPKELVGDILDTFYHPGSKVLDPFMGTGSLGVEVLRRNGQFVGYEIIKNFYKRAHEKLGGVKRK